MMRRRYAIVALIAALALPVAIAESDTNTQTCPEGQELVGFNAGGLKAEQKALPEGYSIEDTVSGSGRDFKVTSDQNSATVNADVPLTIVCR